MQMQQGIYNAMGEKLVIENQLGNPGAEGTVYLTNTGLALKIFKKSVDVFLKSKKIDHLINQKEISNSFCFPINKVYNENNELAGFTMSLAYGETIQQCIFSRRGLIRKFPTWDRVNIANLGLTILNQIKVLHQNNIIIGDINPHNIMVNSENEIYFIDTDSFQIQNLLCTVGKPLFTAPELQGLDYETMFRNVTNEYFPIATLLFMLFLPGKNPFEHIGCSDLSTNIKNQYFAYPLGDDDNLQAPNGIWEFIWNDLNYDLRASFYSVFKNHKRLNIDEWIAVINSYKDDLIRGACSKDIFPSLIAPKLAKYKSLNLNRRNINEFDKKLRTEKTELLIDRKNFKIGVLELSTTAVKILIGNDRKIKSNPSNFHSEDYLNRSDRTNTGSLLDADNIMDIEVFKRDIIPCIKNRIDFAIQNKVKTLYSVATAAYRTAYNRKQITAYIKEKCGINVRILTKKEEAALTLYAFSFSKPQQIIFEKSKNYLFIDQGGGSTEITVFKGQEIIYTYSINLGSIVLKNIFFKESTEKTTFEKAFKDSYKLIKDRLRVYLGNYYPTNLGKFCVSVGSPIIEATGGKTFLTKHGIPLNSDDIKLRILEFEEKLYSYSSIAHLYDAIQEEYKKSLRMEKKFSQLDNILAARLALPMYLEIMERFKIETVIVSNTGLFYGVYLDKLLNS